MYNKLRALLTKRLNLPKEYALRRAVGRFTLAERSIFYFFVGLFILTGAILLLRVNDSYLTQVPLRGGTLTEGVIGNPRFINPVLALSQADKDLTALVYSGLLRTTPDGNVVNDLADDLSVSPDGLTYTAHIRSDARFHDGSPVTAADIVFTVGKIEDGAIKSPLFGDWSGVTVAAIDDQTVSFTLKTPYSPFIDNLTVGILPKHIWSEVSDDEFSFSQFNSLPIGSGLYQVTNIERDSGGIPNYYELTPAADSGEPYIAHLVFKFYPSEAALLNAYDSGDIQSLSGILPTEAVTLEKQGAKVLSAPLPRVFGVFFNQSNNKALLEKDVREALDLAAPKEEIVSQVLQGFGTPIDGPLPPGSFSWASERATSTLPGARFQEAAALLAKNGWTLATSTGILEKKTKSGTLTLSFTLSTSDNAELKAVADVLKNAWTALGAKVDVEVFDSGDLNQSVIRPRRYDALLFGEVVGKDADVYPFWHSSERNDPGLNIALYANSDVDKLLENARSTTDPEKRESDYKSFQEDVEADVPAVFLYSPSLLYVASPSVHGLSLGPLGAPEDRFQGLRDWYIETDNVWNIFVHH